MGLFNSVSGNILNRVHPLRVCMVTICIGDRYLQIYNTLFRPSQEAYAKKHGYDFNVITDYLGGKKKDPALISLNKMLVCEGREEYDFVLFVDADVIVNVETAPPIHLESSFRDHRVGVVNQSQPTLEARYAVSEHNGSERTAKDYYQLAGFDLEVEHIVNTGCLLLQPIHHRDLMRKFYNKHEEAQLTHSRKFHFEQSCIGYELYTHNMVSFLDHKWNALWANQRTYYNHILKKPITLDKFFQENYFVHLVGHTDFHEVPRLNRMMINKGIL